MWHRIFKKVKNFILKEGLLFEGDNVVVGVSGGPDSCALLDMLYILSKQMKLNLTVAHFNHAIRGTEALRDERFVEELSKKYGLNFVKGKSKFSTKKGEEELREERLKFLQNIARKKNAKIALAHHLDDQVETVLMRIFRGTGIRGLSGMRPISGNIVRPFLCLWRNEIFDYLKERNLNYVFDSTNNDISYARNFIRLKVIPLLEGKFHGLKEAILRLSASSFEDSLFLDEVSRSLLNKVKKTDNEIKVLRDDFLPLPSSLRKRTFAFITELMGVIPDYDLVQKIDSFFLGGKNTSLSLKGKLFIENDGENFIFRREERKKIEYFYEISSIPAEIEIKEAQLKLKFTRENFHEEAFKSGQEAVFDAHKVKYPLRVRTWKKGDFMFPFGIKGRKKLKEIFVDEKISSCKRYLFPVIEDAEGNIIWVVKLKQDCRFKVDENTREIIRITVI